jgi:predicted enzyme related to lactoylglutathione lyase
MKIKLTSVFVNDQEKALQFYTKILGFVKKSDFPVGEYRWLTLTSPEEPEGAQLLLEPNANSISREFQESIFKIGRGAASFFVDDIQFEFERLKKLGVQFQTAPTQATGSAIAIFNDGCGNLIQLVQLG